MSQDREPDGNCRFHDLPSEVLQHHFHTQGHSVRRAYGMGDVGVAIFPKNHLPFSCQATCQALGTWTLWCVGCWGSPRVCPRASLSLKAHIPTMTPQILTFHTVLSSDPCPTFLVCYLTGPFGCLRGPSAPWAPHWPLFPCCVLQFSKPSTAPLSHLRGTLGIKFDPFSLLPASMINIPWTRMSQMNPKGVGSSGTLTAPPSNPVLEVIAFTPNVALG